MIDEKPIEGNMFAHEEIYLLHQLIIFISLFVCI